MKRSFLTSAFLLFLQVNLFSQTPPTPPNTNSTTSISKGNSYSFTFDTEESEENSSVSIKRNDIIYKFSAKFHKSKTEILKKILIDKLGKSNLTINGDTFRWIKNESGEKLYDCKLTERTLKIYVDKEYTNSKIADMIDELGLDIKFL